MNEVIISVGLLVLLCSLGVNVIQVLEIRQLRSHVAALEGLRDSLKARICRDEMFHYRVQQAEAAFQAVDEPFWPDSWQK